MTLRMSTIEYASGHKCIDNGVGDYDLKCPDYPDSKHFIPYAFARSVITQKACPFCLRLIGAVLE